MDSILCLGHFRPAWSRSFDSEIRVNFAGLQVCTVPYYCILDHSYDIIPYCDKTRFRLQSKQSWYLKMFWRDFHVFKLQIQLSKYFDAFPQVLYNTISLFQVSFSPYPVTIICEPIWWTQLTFQQVMRWFWQPEKCQNQTAAWYQRYCSSDLHRKFWTDYTGYHGAKRASTHYERYHCPP